jgi:hypothetical protein
MIFKAESNYAPDVLILKEGICMTDLKKRQLMQKYINTKGISHMENRCGLTFKEFCEQEDYYEKLREEYEGHQK